MNSRTISLLLNMVLMAIVILKYKPSDIIMVLTASMVIVNYISFMWLEPGWRMYCDYQEMQRE